MAREEAAGRTPLAIEMSFRFPVGREVVEGRWDRIDETPEGIVLIDYKTSDVDDPERADRRAEKSLAEDQLGMYALAYRETRGVLPARVELHFVDTGRVGRASVAEEHLDRARERVTRAAAGIRAARFAPAPDPRKCVDCPYSRFCPHSAARGGG